MTKANNPFRRGPKIGRNDPCFCGSNKKFKHCHGGVQHTLPALLSRDKFEKDIIEQGQRHFERHKVKELQRQKQQGLGRPIISTEFKGYRFIAVGNKLHYGRWKSFSDFLTNYIKDTFGKDWGNTEISKPIAERHPVLQWYDKICRLQKLHANKPGEIFSTPLTGAVNAYNRLAYNLYLIAHNGEDIETKLINRLKNNDNFQGAYFEIQVAAWLIKAGFELEFEDESDRASKHCEFTATYVDTGNKYSVEAKSREIETTKNSRAKVGSKLYGALEKDANHKRLIFINLNKPIHTLEAANRAMDRAERIIQQHEKLIINGEPAPEAYVCVTNMNDQYVLDTSSIATMVTFRGYKIDDFMGSEFPSFREAARARERHWPMFQLLKSIEEHQEIPQTFEGELPSEVFASDQPPRLQIGQYYEVPGPDGAEVKAKLTEAIMMKDKAFCAFYDPTTDNAWMGTFVMTPDELSDYAKHPDTYFGVHKKQSRKAETAMDMFDFFVDSYRKTPKEKLIELLSHHPNQESLQGMTQPELVELLAEGYTMNMVSRGAFAKQLPDERRNIRGQSKNT